MNSEILKTVLTERLNRQYWFLDQAAREEILAVAGDTYNEKEGGESC